MMKQAVNFNVEGMQCDACANRLYDALASIVGVEQAAVSFNEARARVVFETTEVHVNQLTAAIREAGFTVPSGCP
jgi:copper chaperone CopZ